MKLGLKEKRLSDMLRMKLGLKEKRLSDMLLRQTSSIKPLIFEPAVLQKKKDSFIKEESDKLLFNKQSRADAFIKGLRFK